MEIIEFQHQTLDILCCFFDEPYLETDSGDNDFDPVKIANQLKQLGDHYDETVIQPLMRDVKKATTTDQAGAAFSNCVDILCNTWVSQSPEVVREKHLLNATMAVSLYIKNNCPELTSLVRGATVNILNNRLGTWIMQQGGWNQVYNQ